jgi:hypothetical protein
MSKKLIAVASAAALALSALVAVPAGAALVKSPATMNVTTSGVADGSVGTLADPIELALPGMNDLSVANTLLTVTVTSDLKTRAVTITSGVGATLLNEKPDSTNKFNAKSGSKTLSVTSTSTGSTEFYVYTTSTAKTKITISYAAAAGKEDSDAVEFYVQGIKNVELAWNVSVDEVKLVQVGKSGFVTANVTDVFGNDITEDAAAKLKLTVAGAGSANTLGNFAFNATSKKQRASYDVTRSGTYGIGVELTTDTTDTVVDSASWGAAKNVFFTSFTAAALDVQVATLTAQVAALTAQLAASRPKANSVTKKRWNRLVRAHRALGGTAKLK